MLASDSRNTFALPSHIASIHLDLSMDVQKTSRQRILSGEKTSDMFEMWMNTMNKQIFEQQPERENRRECQKLPDMFDPKSKRRAKKELI